MLASVETVGVGRVGAPREGEPALGDPRVAEAELREAAVKRVAGACCLVLGSVSRLERPELRRRLGQPSVVESLERV